jgi:hypothetical protein
MFDNIAVELIAGLGVLAGAILTFGLTKLRSLVKATPTTLDDKALEAIEKAIKEALNKPAA